MKLKTIIAIGILLPFILGSCKKENESKSLISISGITELDFVANIIGNLDTTDWKFTDTWTFDEENLFKKNNLNHNAATELVRPNSSVLVIGYPNPSKEGVLLFYFQLETGMYYDLRIVDDNLNVKAQFDSIDSRYIHLNDSGYISNKLYRAYYKIYSDNKVYRGHGDFKFVK